MERKSLQAFQIHEETAELLEEMEPQQAGLMIQAMCKYHFFGDAEWLRDKTLRLAFVLIRGRMDRDAAAYADKCAKNRANILERYKQGKETPREPVRPNTNEYDRIPTATESTNPDPKPKGSEEPERKKKKEKGEILKNWLKRGWNKFYRRRKGTAWSKKELDKLAEIVKRPEVLSEHRDILRLYNGGYLYFRKDLQTLLNNWAGELDRAHGERPGNGTGNAGRRKEEGGKRTFGMG